MDSCATIRLAGRDYAVRTLTFRDLRNVLPLFPAALQWARCRLDDLSVVEGLDAAVGIIAVATGRSSEDVLDIPCNVIDVALAIIKVAEISGLIVSKDSSPGEPQAGQSTGVTSTPT
jgi:hypothetical protein